MQAQIVRYGFLCIFVQRQLIQIYSVDWQTFTIHTPLDTEQNHLAVKVSADN